MRKTKPKKRILLPDPKFNDVLVTRFVNDLMVDGKKTVAFKIFYDALDIVEEKMAKKEETKKPEPETAAGTGARKAGTSEALKEKEPEISETVKKGRKGRASEALDMISERVGRLIKK